MGVIPSERLALPQAGLGYIKDYAAAHPVLTAFTSFFTLIFAAYIYFYPYTEYRLSYRNVPGPPRSSFLFGNLPEIVKLQTESAPHAWHNKYGSTIRYSYFLGNNRFTTTDPRGSEYILQHTDLFVRPPQMTRVMGWVFGKGILTVEGEAHKRQRRVLSPGFGPKAIREMMPAFWDIAYQLSQKLDGLLETGNDVATSPTPAVPIDRVPGTIKIDVLKYMGQATLDVNGRAGFDYEL